MSRPIRALSQLGTGDYIGIYADADHFAEVVNVARLVQNERILQGMPDGVVLLDSDNTILWGNGRLREWTGREDIVGANFYDVMGTPEILGPDFCPFHTALATGKASGSTLRCFQNRYMRVHAAPVIDAEGTPQHLVVTIREVTDEVLQQQKLSAIHQAGIELADLTPDEVAKMSVDERIELLRSNILHCTQDVLHYDVVEIRMLDPKTKILEPVLAVGMTPEAAKRVLAGRDDRQRRDRLCRRHRQELPVRRHERGSALSGRRRRRSQLVHRARHAARPRDRHAQRRKPRAAGVQRKRSAIPGDFRSRRRHGAQHAGVAGRRKGEHRRRQRRGHSQRGRPAGRRHSQRRRQRDGALHRPPARRRRAACNKFCATPATSSR